MKKLLIILTLIGCTKKDCKDKMVEIKYCLEEPEVIYCQFESIESCEDYKKETKSTGICYEGPGIGIETCTETSYKIL